VDDVDNELVWETVLPILGDEGILVLGEATAITPILGDLFSETPAFFLQLTCSNWARGFAAATAVGDVGTNAFDAPTFCSKRPDRWVGVVRRILEKGVWRKLIIIV
jgi:hypothetical protein